MGDKSTSYISLNDYLRIKESCAIFVDRGEKQKMEDKKALKAKSNNRVKNWGNTIDAQRRKKEENTINNMRQEEVDTIYVIYIYIYI